MFEKFIINIETETNIFEKLSYSVQYENVANGRKGAVLVHIVDDMYPIVRTTTCYNTPVQKFETIHYQIIENIKRLMTVGPLPLELTRQARDMTNQNIEFNNALIEIYDSNYRTMGYHSDQSLDLAENSYICIFSCYSEPDTKKYRTLKIKNKLTEKCSDIVMEHNSIIIFSLAVNSENLHKIILEQNSSSKWLGITFRLSKTFINYLNKIPYFYPTTRILKLANEQEKKKFYEYRGNENKNIGYNYPDINFTISQSDTWPINSGLYD